MIITDRGGPTIPTPSGTTLHSELRRQRQRQWQQRRRRRRRRPIDRHFVFCTHAAESRRKQTEKKKTKTEHHNNNITLYTLHGRVVVLNAQQLSLPPTQHIHDCDDHNNPHDIIIIIYCYNIL